MDGHRPWRDRDRLDHGQTRAPNRVYVRAGPANFLIGGRFVQQDAAGRLPGGASRRSRGARRRGCGGGGSSSSSAARRAKAKKAPKRRRRRRRRIERRRRNADGRLRHPLSPVRAGEKGQLHRLRRRTDGSDRQRDRPRTGIHRLLLRNDLPRRRAGQVRSGDVGGDDHRRTRKGRRLLAALLPLRTGDPGQRRQLDHRPRRPEGQSRRRPAGHDRPRTRQGKSRSQGTPALPRRPRRGQRAEGRDGRSGDHRRAGRRNSRPKNSAASKSSKKSRPKKRTGSRSPRKTPNWSNRSTKA